jgi:TusA-related sulfurtransferase
MEVVALPTSVNRLTDAGGLRCPSPLIKIEKQKKSPNLVRNQV